MNVFIDTTVYAASYKQDMTITDAYAFLKALPDFSEAEDIVDPKDASLEC